MDFTGEYKVPASRDKVWEALNDVDVLKLCIDGCEELNKDSDTEFSAKVTAKVGPVRAKFTGKVTLSDIDPPNGYTISGEGQGGVAGFAKGGAIVKLVECDGATILHYEAKAEVVASWQASVVVWSRELQKKQLMTFLASLLRLLVMETLTRRRRLLKPNGIAN